MVSILVLGDSVVKQVSRYSKLPNARYDSNLGLDQTQYTVYWRGISRGKIANYHDPKQAIPDLEVINPDILIIQIGSNDVCDLGGSEDPLEIGYKLAEMVGNFISQLSVKKVIVSSILPRTRIHKKMRLSLNRYNKAVSDINSWLEGLYRRNGTIKFWRHTRFETSFIHMLINENDRVLLTQRGYVRWVRGIRGGLLPFLSVLTF